MSNELADLTLSIFLLSLRKELVEHRRSLAYGEATPDDVLNAVISSLDQALKTTKGDIAGKRGIAE